jgi:hypothetical protein
MATEDCIAASSEPSGEFLFGSQGGFAGREWVESFVESSPKPSAVLPDESGRSVSDLVLDEPFIGRDHGLSDVD